MSVAGLCAVCGTSEVVGACDRCGSVVCERHYEPAVGFCVECAGEVGTGDRPDGNDRTEADDTYRF